jgi:hypothetical protein
VLSKLKIQLLKYFSSFNLALIAVFSLLMLWAYAQKNRLLSLALTEIFQADVFIEDSELQISYAQFPLTQITLHKVIILGTNPEVREKAATIEKAIIKINPLDFFPSDTATPKKIQSIQIKKAFFDFKLDKKWVVNYQFFKKKKASNTGQKRRELIIKALVIDSSRLHFSSAPKQSQLKLYIDRSFFKIHIKPENILLDIALRGQTQGYNTPRFSLLYNKPLLLNVQIDYHKATRTFHFLQNSTLNLVGAEIKIHGKFKSEPKRKEYDLNLYSHAGNINMLISLLPSNIEEALQNFKSGGDLILSGQIQGVYDDWHYPFFRLDFRCKNVNIENQKTGGAIENFNLKGHYTNGSNASLATTALAIEHFEGKLAENQFAGAFTIYDFSRALIQCKLKGALGVAQLIRFAGVALDSAASGTAQVDITFKGGLKNLEKSETIDQFYYSGFIQLDNVNLKPEALPLAITHGKGLLKFANNDILVQKLQAAINNQYIECSGKIHQIIPYIIGKRATLEMGLNLYAQNWHINEFMHTLQEIQKLPKRKPKNKKKYIPKEKNKTLHLPDSVALSLNLSAQNCIYKNLTWNYLTAKIELKNKFLEIRKFFAASDNETLSGELRWNETAPKIQKLNLRMQTATNDLRRLLARLQEAPQKENSDTIPFQLQGEIEANGYFEPHWSPTLLEKAFLHVQFRNWKVNKVQSKLNIRGLSFSTTLNQDHILRFSQTPFSIDSLKGKIKNYPFEAQIHIDNWIQKNVRAQLFSQISIPLFLSYFSLPTIKAYAGILKMNISLAGKLSEFLHPDSIVYTPQKGQVKIENLYFQLKEKGLPFENINADIYFDNKGINLHSFSGKFDGSPLQIRGVLINLLPYLYLKKESLSAKLFISTDFVNLRHLLSKNKKKPESGFLFKIPDKTNIVAKMNIKKVFFDSLAFNDVQFIGNVKNKILQIERFDAQFCQGSANIQGQIDASGADSVRISAQAKLSHIEISELLKGLNNFNQDFITADEVSGLFSAQIELQDKMPDNLKNDLSQTQIRLDFTVSHGNLQHFEPLQKLKGLLRKKYLEEVPFNITGRNLFFSAKTLTIPEIILHSSIAQLRIQGRHSQYVDYKIDVIYSHKFTKEDFRKTLLTFQLIGASRPYKLKYDGRKAFQNLVYRFKPKLKE